ncbi:MAG: NAD-binding protein [Bacilli bacterium]|jgi:trk system potassium uptake protein TrkA
MKVLIIGGGQVGLYIAKLLLSNNCEVKVIENRDGSVAKLKKALPEGTVVVGSGSDPNILESCGIGDADVVAAVTGADETNLVAATIAKFEFGVPRVIANVNNPSNAWLFNASMGVDVTLNQADLMAHIVIEEMDLKNMMTLMKMNHGNFSIVQVKVSANSRAVNKDIKDLDLPAQAVLFAIYRGENVLIPRGNTTICSGDDVLAFTDDEGKIRINDLFGN